MRSAVFVAILVSTSALLAGCSDKKDDHEDSYTCPNGTVLDLEDFPEHHNSTFNPLSKCPKTSGSGTGSGSASQAPNQLPVLKLNVTDMGGNVTNVTVLDGNLTFDATGSSDPDGQITGIAVSVTDSNTTRTASLFDAVTKTFKNATFNFDRPGIVNVTVAMVDDRAGFTVNQTKVYVNHPQVLPTQMIGLPGGGEFAVCTGSGEALLDEFYRKEFSFTVGAGATLATATATPASTLITICTPDADPLTNGCQCEMASPTAPGETTTNIPLVTPVGVGSYKVWATLPAGVPNVTVAMTVLVHYEPQAAAPAAE